MNLIKHLQYVPKHFALVLAAVAATATVANSLAWGPNRDTYTTAKPADHIVFNSITDNPAYGDERDFMRVKPADAPNSAYSNKTKLVPGKEYVVYVYYHNNAAANLNLVAQNTKLQTKLPAIVNGDTQAVSYIDSSNANPTRVWDEATLTSDSPMAIRMVPGSATIHNQGSTNGKKLADSIITTGTPLGFNALDGKIPGCNKFAGYVTFTFVADQPNFTVQKMVSKHGENKWVENYTAKAGETVDYLLQYKNTGTTQQNNVVIKDTLPQNMTYVAGSAKLGNPTNPGGVKASDNVTTAGLNVGGYNPGQNAWVIFSATAPGAEKLTCGKNSLVNKETVETANGSKSDTATIDVTKTCTETPPANQVQVCDKTTGKLKMVDSSKKDHYLPVGDKACKPSSTPTPQVAAQTTPETQAQETPKAVASTGPEAVLSGLFGSSALGYSAYAYAQSRRSMFAQFFKR